jgi:hypothetical protein
MSIRWGQPTQEETTTKTQISRRPVCAMKQRVVNVDRTKNKNGSWINDSECTAGTIVVCFEIQDDDDLPHIQMSEHKRQQTPKSKTWKHYIDNSTFVQNVLGNKMGLTIDVQFWSTKCPENVTVCTSPQTLYSIRISGIQKGEYVQDWLDALGKYFHNKIEEKQIDIDKSTLVTTCGLNTFSFFRIEGTLPQKMSYLNEQTMLSKVLLATKNNLEVQQTNLNETFDMEKHKSHLINIKLTHQNKELTPWIWTRPSTRSNQALIMPIDLINHRSD